MFLTPIGFSPLQVNRPSSPTNVFTDSQDIVLYGWVSTCRDVCCTWWCNVGRYTHYKLPSVIL